VVNDLVAGTPAALSGQLHAGDRILGIAQGNNMFVDAQNLPLPDVIGMIRGAPGTPVQLQVLPADAAPNSLPRTVIIYRDQIKFKN
jgi:carboxyl-terminal processing protease